MLKRSVLGIILATGVASHVCAENQRGFYVGAQYNVHSLESDTGTGDMGSLGVATGYKFNQYISIEGRADLGIKDYSETEDDGTVLTIDAKNSLSAYIKGSYPLSKQFTVYGLAGFHNTKYELSVHYQGLSASVSEKESGFAYGAGVEFSPTQNWSFGLEYVVLPEAELLEGFTLDADNLTFLARYRF